VLSPHLQVEGVIKTTYQETSALLHLPYLHLAEWVTPFPSIKLFYLSPSTCSAWVLPFGAQGPRSFVNDCLQQPDLD
jgi:hypothetical protein